MRDLGELNCTYMQDSLAKPRLLDCATVASSPTEPGYHLEVNPALGNAPLSAPDAFEVATPGFVRGARVVYGALVGSWMYLRISKRPDLAAYSVRYLARVLNNHNITHMNAVLKCVVGTVELGISDHRCDTRFLGVLRIYTGSQSS